MNAVTASREGERDARLYAKALLELYIALPGTPDRASRGDCRLARALHEREVSLSVVGAAFLLAVARRTMRSVDAAPLGPIRTLHYFLPVIEEILERPLDAGYLAYLARKLGPYLPTNMQTVFMDTG